jgi:hypothetical protein
VCPTEKESTRGSDSVHATTRGGARRQHLEQHVELRVDTASDPDAWHLGRHQQHGLQQGRDQASASSFPSACAHAGGTHARQHLERRS